MELLFYTTQTLALLGIILMFRKWRINTSVMFVLVALVVGNIVLIIEVQSRTITKFIYPYEESTPR